MKKERAQTKKDEKEKKKQTADEKIKLKADKKAAKELAKEAKKKEKEDAKQAKKAAKKKEKEEAKKTKGRSAKDKTAERMTKGGKKKEQGKKAGKEETPDVAKDEPQLSELSPTREDASEMLQPEAPEPNTKQISPVKSRQMKRLRRLASSWKISPTRKQQDLQEDQEVAADEGEEEKDPEDDDGDQARMETKEPSDLENAGEKKMTKKKIASKRKMNDSGDKTGGKKKKMKEEKPSKKNETDSKTKAAKVSKKVPKKPKSEEGSKAAKKTSPKKKIALAANQAAKALAIETLKECKTSNCTHPSFVRPNNGKNIQCSTYWTRNAVGVKVARKFFQNDKAKGKGMSQVAYFGGPECPCTYASWIMAGIFVPWMHHRESIFLENIYFCSTVLLYIPGIHITWLLHKKLEMRRNI